MSQPENSSHNFDKHANTKWILGIIVVVVIGVTTIWATFQDEEQPPIVNVTLPTGTLPTGTLPTGTLPTAKIFGPNEATINKLVTFTADDSHVEDGFIEKYQWMVNGKNYGVQSFLEHTFENAATYQVTLDILDNNGQPGRDVMSVTVSDDLPPPVDSDGDGILDNVDQCPNSPENYNNFQDADGCPDTLPDPPVSCIEEGTPKPSIKIIAPEDGIEISKTNVYVKVRAQTDEFGIDYIGVALDGVNKASTSPGLGDCELSVDIKDLKEGGNTIKAVVWGTSDRGNPISTQITVYVNTK